MVYFKKCTNGTQVCLGLSSFRTFPAVSTWAWRGQCYRKTGSTDTTTHSINRKCTAMSRNLIRDPWVFITSHSSLSQSIFHHSVILGLVNKLKWINLLSYSKKNLSGFIWGINDWQSRASEIFILLGMQKIPMFFFLAHMPNLNCDQQTQGQVSACPLTLI